MFVDGQRLKLCQGGEDVENMFAGSRSLIDHPIRDRPKPIRSTSPRGVDVDGQLYSDIKLPISLTPLDRPGMLSTMAEDRIPETWRDAHQIR